MKPKLNHGKNILVLNLLFDLIIEIIKVMTHFDSNEKVFLFLGKKNEFEF